MLQIEDEDRVWRRLESSRRAASITASAQAEKAASHYAGTVQRRCFQVWRAWAREHGLRRKEHEELKSREVAERAREERLHLAMDGAGRQASGRLGEEAKALGIKRRFTYKDIEPFPQWLSPKSLRGHSTALRQLRITRHFLQREHRNDTIVPFNIVKFEQTVFLFGGRQFSH